MSQDGAVKSLYQKLEAKRRPFLDRARACAQLTIPSLLPPDGHTYTNTLPTPFQAVGARGVNNLSSKLLLALLPPNAPFFRLLIGEDALRNLTAAGGNIRTEAEQALAAIERQIQDEIEAAAYRVPAFEAFKHSIVAGNALVHIDDDGMRVFHLDKYVVERDGMGSVLTIITKECLNPAALPVEMRAAVELARADSGQQTNYDSREEVIEVYTKVERESATSFSVYQEVCGQIVPGSEGTFKNNLLPYIPIRFNHISGEDYGRGHVEEYLGDLQSLEALSQAIVEGSAAAARVLFLVNPNGSTRMKRLAEAPNGAFIEGTEEDVGRLQLEKFNDFKTAADTMEKLKEQLAFAFLLNTAIQRQGERVTAEEIRFMAGELEDTLGGVYSILSQEFQLPLVQIVMAQMTKARKIPRLPKGVRPAVVTGIEALGRGHDLQRLQVALKTAADLFGPEAVLSLVNPIEGLTRILTASGVEPEGLVKTQDQVNAEQQQAQAQAAVQKLGPEVVRQIGNHASNQAAAAPQGQPPAAQ